MMLSPVNREVRPFLSSSNHGDHFGLCKAPMACGGLLVPPTRSCLSPHVRFNDACQIVVVSPLADRQATLGMNPTPPKTPQGTHRRKRPLAQGCCANTAPDSLALNFVGSGIFARRQGAGGLGLQLDSTSTLTSPGPVAPRSPPALTVTSDGADDVEVATSEPTYPIDAFSPGEEEDQDDQIPSSRHKRQTEKSDEDEDEDQEDEEVLFCPSVRRFRVNVNPMVLAAAATSTPPILRQPVLPLGASQETIEPNATQNL